MAPLTSMQVMWVNSQNAGEEYIYLQTSIKGLSDNAALESLKGTPDQWLLDDEAYVASVLRESASRSTTVQASSADALYTLSDLDALGQYASALSAMEKPNNTNIYTMDEARIGLDFSMIAMKTDALQNSGNISDAMAGLLQKTMDGFMQSYLVRLDDQLSANRNAGIVADDKTGFAALDRDTVWDVYNQAIQLYRSDGDAMQAFIKGAEYGASKPSAQSAGGAWRYQNNASYWTNFFGKSTGGNRLGAYESPDSTFQKYMAGWTDFKNSLDSGNSVRMNLMLQSADQYMMTAGSLLSKNI